MRERALVRVVRLGEAQRRVQRERQLEAHERHLLRLAALLEQRQQHAVVADRLVERVLLPRLVARAHQVVDRLVLVLRREPVVGEQRERVVGRVGAALEPDRRLAMQAPPLAADDRAVDGLLDQDVLEAKLGLRPAAALAQQVEPLQLAERLAQLLLAAGDAGEQREAEVAAEHRRRGQRLAALGGEAVDAREDHLLDRRRHVDRDVVVEAPAGRGQLQRAGVDERAHELLEEERVALGLREQPPLEVGGQRALADERQQQLALGVAGERLELDRVQPVRQLPRGLLAHRPRGVVGVGALRDDQQDGRVLGHRQQLLGQLQRRLVGPVDVFEHEHDRALRRRASRAGGGRPRRCGTAAPPARARRGARGTRARGQAEQRREVRVVVVGALAGELVERAAQREPRAQLGVVEAEAEPVAQQVAERPVLHRLAVGDAAAFEPRRLGARRRSSPRKRLLPIPGSPETKRIEPAPAWTSLSAACGDRQLAARGRRAACRSPRGRARWRLRPPRPAPTRPCP